MSAEIKDKKENLNIDNEIICFFGPEGAGKSNRAKDLATLINKPYVSIGDILRDMKDYDRTYLGDECRAMFAESRYLDPKMLLLILTKYFSVRSDLSNGFVLDGGMRTITEAVGFPEVLKNSNKDMPLTVVYLKVPYEVSMSRLTHEETGRKRSDDTPERVANRLKNFNYQLEERITAIKQNYQVIEIDARPSEQEVFEEICNRLNSR